MLNDAFDCLFLLVIFDFLLFQNISVVLKLLSTSAILLLQVTAIP